jgi:putative ATPase
MDLFEAREARLTAQNAPLAARMRPRYLLEYIGQEHIMAPGRLLRRAIEADRLSSLIFYGPPGTGKTTLARVIANHTSAHFEAINAVLAGVKDLREAIAAARERLGREGRRTVLFIDEVHRFNKAQQDALLPWVEQGTIILIGATTENPYFEVNKALVSRSRIFQLETLSAVHLHKILEQALHDKERGYGQRSVIIDPDASAHLVEIANGDARALLGALELAVETTPADASGAQRITLAIAEESIQRRAVLYDKEGDVHFDVISAYIKSLRGSDPDASLYWLARMVYAGEEPRFIFRRLLIFASEDVGLADPRAIQVIEALASAYDRVGMPEGRYHLSHATLYLATAPKSNSTMGFFDALAAIGREREGSVPTHLKDGTRDGGLWAWRGLSVSSCVSRSLGGAAIYAARAAGAAVLYADDAGL